MKSFTLSLCVLAAILAVHGGDTPPHESATTQLHRIIDRGDHAAWGRLRREGADATMRDQLLKGGQSELPAVVPGDGDSSAIVRFASDQVEDLEMPPLSGRATSPALTPAELRTLRIWIDEGVAWPEGLTLRTE